MKAEHFERIIRSFQKRVPFRPFWVEMVSGTRVEVDHPEALVVRSGIAVFLNKTGSPSFFDHEGVSQVTDTAKRNGSKH